MPDSERFRLSQISHFLNTIWIGKRDPPSITPYEQWCSNTMDQRGGISLIYAALQTNLDKPSYARAWEEDTGSTWNASEWYQVSKRSFKGISLIEASLKVLTRWYYVPFRLALIYPGTLALCFRGCELEGSMIHIWWTCPRIRSFWWKIFRTISSLAEETVTPSPNIALLNHYIPKLTKHLQTLSFFILLGAKITIAKAWKRPTVSFQACRTKISWIMAQEHIVAKLYDQIERFNATWEPWATLCNIPLLPGMENASRNLLPPH